MWRFTESPSDGRLLVYRSEDIKNISRLSSPKVCGYVNADAQELLPEEARAAGQTEQEEGVYLHMYGTLPQRTVGHLILETGYQTSYHN